MLIETNERRPLDLDSTLIMQLLRDNLTLWTTDMPGENDAAQNEVQDVDDDRK